MARTHNSKRLIDVAKDAVISVLETLTPKDKVGLFFVCYQLAHN